MFNYLKTKVFAESWRTIPAFGEVWTYKKWKIQNCNLRTRNKISTGESSFCSVSLAAISEMPPHPSPVLWRPFLNKLVFVALPPTEPEPIKPACLFNRSASELWDFDALKGNINLDRLSSYQVLINWTVSCRWPDQVVSQFLKQRFKWLHSLRKLTLVF